MCPFQIRRGMTVSLASGSVPTRWSTKRQPSPLTRCTCKVTLCKSCRGARHKTAVVLVAVRVQGVVQVRPDVCLGRGDPWRCVAHPAQRAPRDAGAFPKLMAQPGRPFPDLSHVRCVSSGQPRCEETRGHMKQQALPHLGRFRLQPQSGRERWFGLEAVPVVPEAPLHLRPRRCSGRAPAVRRRPRRPDQSPPRSPRRGRQRGSTPRTAPRPGGHLLQDPRGAPGLRARAPRPRGTPPLEGGRLPEWRARWTENASAGPDCRQSA